jgi:heptosyltransferase-2
MVDDAHAVLELMQSVRVVGIDTSDLGLDMYAVYPEEVRFADEYLAGVDAGLTIGLNIGAANAERRWPVERFAALGLALQDKYPNCRIWVNTAPSERCLRDAYHALAGTPRTLYSPSLTIGQLGGLISRCDLLITNDTGPMHIGIAARVRTLAIFGPNLVDSLSPLDSRPFKGVRGWPMEQLQADEVLAAAVELLDGD